MDCILWASRRVKELELSEDLFKQGMDEHVLKIMQPKRLLFFRELLDITGYPDAEQLIAEMNENSGS